MIFVTKQSCKLLQLTLLCEKDFKLSTNAAHIISQDLSYKSKTLAGPLVPRNFKWSQSCWESACNCYFFYYFKDACQSASRTRELPRWNSTRDGKDRKIVAHAGNLLHYDQEKIAEWEETDKTYLGEWWSKHTMTQCILPKKLTATVLAEIKFLKRILIEHHLLTLNNV